MTTTAFLRHIDDNERRGGALSLYGLSPVDGVSLRAWIGPRDSAPTCGAFIAYSEGDAVAKLCGTTLREGCLKLGVFNDGGADHVTAKLVAGAAGNRQGRLTLRSIGDDGQPHTTVQLDAGSSDIGHARLQRGKLILKDEEGDQTRGRIELGFDDGGPYLMLTKGGRTLTLTVDWGLQLPPDMMMVEEVREREF